MNYIIDWKNLIQSNYSVNPWVFIFLYVVTIIPFWYVFFLIIKKLKSRNKNLAGLVILELFILVFPYLYIFLFGKNIPLWIYLAVILLILLSFLDLWMRITKSTKKRNQSNIFWDIYSSFYKATIYQSIPHIKMFENVVDEMKLSGDVKILDAGCGPGDLIGYLVNSRENLNVTGIDFSEVMLKKAKKKYSNNNNITLLRADLDEKLPFGDNSFDNIAGVSVLFAVPNIERTLREYRRVLKNEGKIILVEPTPEFNYFKILKEHLALMKGLNFPDKLFTYCLMVLKLPILVILYVMNLFMDRWEKNGKYHYFTKEEMIVILKSVGFNSIETKSELSGQDIMYIAKIV